jgi:hypothetical protein
MELKITMIPALEDPDNKSPAYQGELAEFAKSLKNAGVEYEAKPGKLLLTDTSPFSYAGTFVIGMITGLSPILVNFVAVWLHGRSGRKVRLKVDEIEAEAQTIQEVEKLLALAQEIHDRNQPKVIHEP